MDPDLSLLQRWRDGDSHAGEELFSRHFEEIYQFFEHKVGLDVDDLVQQTFMACIAGRDEFRGRSTFRTYLFAIARNQLYMHLRRLSRREHVDFEHTSIGEIVTSPSSQLGHAREVERLRDALVTLPAEQQLLLELHYWHELDAESIAEVFEATPGAIRVRLLRARNALRKRMETTDLGESQDSLLAALSRPERDDLEPRT